MIFKSEGCLGLWAMVGEIRRRIRKNRVPPPRDFKGLMEAWELHGELGAVKRDLRLRVALTGLWLVASNVFFMVTGRMMMAVVVSLPGILIILTGLWRLSLVRDGSYRPFGYWLIRRKYQARVASRTGSEGRW